MPEYTTIGYKLTHDTGFAPNPFHGYLTLATCKPAIRRCRKKGDWVAGFASVSLVESAARNGVHLRPGALIYLMQVTENPIPLQAYFEDARFFKKRPNPRSQNRELRCGDNIYYSLGGHTHQLENEHHGQNSVDDDLHGVNALISRRYYYFGNNAFIPPGGWASLLGIPLSNGRTFRCPEIFVPRLLKHFKETEIEEGIHGRPSMWPEEKMGKTCEDSCARRTPMATKRSCT